MGLVIILFVVEIIIFIVYLPHAPFYWPIPALFIYGLYWYMLDESEVTGKRSWESLRLLDFWSTHCTCVNHIFNCKNDLIKSKQVLFLVCGNKTNMGLINGFGLHGGIFGNMRIYYILPWILFRVPVLREVLMWSGAVSAEKSGDATETILNILKRGHSVCYSFNGMQSLLSKNNDIEFNIDNGLLNFIRTHSIKVVPVHISQESERYSIYKWPMQQFCLETFGFPIPFTIIPKYFGSNEPILLDVNIGVAMTTDLWRTNDEFRVLFNCQLGFSKV